MKTFLTKYVPVCVMLLTICFVAMPHGGHSFDIRCFNRWAQYVFENGIGNIYEGGSNYLPLIHYIFKAFGWTQGSVEYISDHIYYLKSITLLFHFLTGFFLAMLIKKENENWDKTLINVLFYLLNIAILYNTIIWGQVDAIMTCFVFISCYFSIKKRVLFSLLFFVLAINFKLQAIIFLPLIGLMLLPVIISNFSVKKIMTWILIPVFLQVLILMPFIMAGTLGDLWNVITGSVGKWPRVSMGAYNMWNLFIDGDLNKVDDNTIFGGLSYKTWGLLLFFLMSSFALFPLAKQGFLSFRQKTRFHVPLEKVLIIFALVPLLFFFFNTQMHERYTHPTFVFLIAFAVYKKKPLIALIGCSAYFFNLEGVLRFMRLSNYKTLIFNRDFVSVLYLITILLLYIELYELKFKRIGLRHDIRHQDIKIKQPF